MSHLRNAWTMAAWAGELPASTQLARTLPLDAAAVRARRLKAALIEKEQAS